MRVLPWRSSVLLSDPMLKAYGLQAADPAVRLAVTAFAMTAAHAIKAYAGTVRVDPVGRNWEALQRTGAVFVTWHRDCVLACCWLDSLGREDRLNWLPGASYWLQHPSLAVMATTRFLELCGATAVLGSSGNGGREALGEVASLMRRHGEGANAMMMPDGPGNTPKLFRKGALHLARESGAPIVALKFQHHAGLPPLPHPTSWDSKLLPIPLSTFTVTCSCPITVPQDTSYDEDVIAKVRSYLDGVDLD